MSVPSNTELKFQFFSAASHGEAPLLCGGARACAAFNWEPVVVDTLEMGRLKINVKKRDKDDAEKSE